MSDSLKIHERIVDKITFEKVCEKVRCYRVKLEDTAAEFVEALIEIPSIDGRTKFANREGHNDDGRGLTTGLSLHEKTCIIAAITLLEKEQEDRANSPILRKKERASLLDLFS